MTDSQWPELLAPAARKSVDITAADAAALNLDINIVVAERLGLELVLVELGPAVWSIDLETSELLWVRHCECDLWFECGEWVVGGAR